MTTPKLPEDRGYMGDRSRGASLGRSDKHGFPAVSYKVSLQRIRLDRGGYDSGGAYWGIGQPLYWARVEGPAGFEMFFRASSRDAAKAIVRERYPHARFYR